MGYDIILCLFIGQSPISKVEAGAVGIQALTITSQLILQHQLRKKHHLHGSRSSISRVHDRVTSFPRPYLLVCHDIHLCMRHLHMLTRAQLLVITLSTNLLHSWGNLLVFEFTYIKLHFFNVHSCTNELEKILKFLEQW